MSPDRQPSGSNRALMAALATAINLGSIAFIVIAPFFPEIAEELDTTVPLIGQVAAARLLVGALLGLLIGPLADAYGHRRLMIAGLVAAAITPLGIALAPSFPLLLLTAIPGGLAAASLTGLTLAVAGSAFPGQAKHRAIGMLSGIQAATGVVVVPILTALGTTIGWRTVFLLCGALATLAIVPVAAPLPRHVGHASARPLRELLRGYVPLLRERETARLYAVVALRSICWGGLVTYFGAYLKEDAGFSGRQVGLAYLLSSLVFFFACMAAGRARFWSLRIRTASGDLSMAIVIGVLFAAPLPIAPLLIVCAVSGASGAFGYVGVSGMLAELAVRRGTGAGITMSLGTALFSLGCAAGGAAGGVLIAVGGYTLMGVVLPVFALIAAVITTVRAHRLV